jgi:hypothetical protein
VPCDVIKRCQPHCTLLLALTIKGYYLLLAPHQRRTLHAGSISYCCLNLLSNDDILSQKEFFSNVLHVQSSVNIGSF